MILNPCTQPTADVSAAGDRGEIMKFVEQPTARQALQNSQSKRRAPDTTARDAKRCAFLF